MKKCIYCGYENEDNNKFCISCGNTLQNPTVNNDANNNQNDDFSFKRPQSSPFNQQQNNQQSNEQQFNQQSNEQQFNQQANQQTNQQQNNEQQFNQQANQQTNQQQANQQQFNQQANQQQFNQQASQQKFNQQANQQQFNQQPNQQFNQQNTYNPNSFPVRNHKNMWIAILLDLIGGLFYYFLCGIGQLYLGLYKRGFVLCLAGLIPLLVGSIFILMDYYGLGTILSLVIGVALVVYSAYDAYLCTNAINNGMPIPLLFYTFDIQ